MFDRRFAVHRKWAPKIDCTTFSRWYQQLINKLTIRRMCPNFRLLLSHIVISSHPAKSLCLSKTNGLIHESSSIFLGAVRSSDASLTKRAVIDRLPNLAWNNSSRCDQLQSNNTKNDGRGFSDCDGHMSHYECKREWRHLTTWFHPQKFIFQSFLDNQSRHYINTTRSTFDWINS